MKHLIKKAVLPLLIFTLLVTVFTAPATASAYSSQNKYVYDDAGLLSSSEYDDIEKMCEETSSKDKVDIVIVTHNDPDAAYAKQYNEDFYDNNLDDRDSVILVVDMSSRDIYIGGYGSAETSVNNTRIDNIVDEITPFLGNGDYTAAFEMYIKDADKYINTPPVYMNPLVQLGVALIIGVVAVAVMAFNAGGKMTVGGNTYMDPNNSGLIGRRDDYIRTQVTRVRKPENNSGGGGGGGVTSGGHSHSGGGGKF